MSLVAIKYQYILAANPISIRVLERHIPGMVCLMRCSLLHVAKRWSFAHSSSLGPSARRISESANAGSARVQANTGCLFSWKIPVTIAKKKSRRRRDHLQHTGNDFGFEFDRHFQGLAFLGLLPSKKSRWIARDTGYHRGPVVISISRSRPNRYRTNIFYPDPVLCEY